MKKQPQTIHLGYEIPTGEPVEIPVAHLVVAGQTQLSGKTTTLEALIARSGLKAIAFVTKRGESAFGGGGAGYPYGGQFAVRPAQPFFHHRADWQFVSDILGAILSEKLKFQRPWIMKVCRGAKTLREVQANVKLQLSGDKQKKIRPATGLTESVYTELDAYFDLLIPEIEALPYTETLELSDGLNVMDLSAYSPALQMLVMASVLDEIYKHYKGVIVVIPEAWEFVPNNKSSPVKSAAITLARKGAALQNFIWLDSQDLASIDTEVRRACSIWILGVQREQNEVKRMLSHIPNAPKPKVDDVMQLERGQFFVCHGREVKRVYVQPAWMSEQMAKDISQGKEPATEFKIRRVKLEDGYKPPAVSMPPMSEDQTHWEITGKVPSPDHPRGWNFRIEKVPSDISVGDTIVEPDNTPKQSDYGTMPAGLEHFIDDGGKSVDQQERERYEQRIADLQRDLMSLRERLVNMPHTRDVRVDLETKNPETLKDIASSIGLFLLADFDFIAAIDARIKSAIPTNGRVIVEPREYVLKEFLQKEVDRILARASQFSKWQKGIVQLLEARGAGMKRAELYRRVGGKEQSGFSGHQTKQMNSEVVDLHDMGFIRWDSKNSYATPNLEAMIKSELSAYNSSDEDVEQTIGQVLLKLKEGAA